MLVYLKCEQGHIMMTLDMLNAFYHFQILLLEGQCQLIVVNTRGCSNIQRCGAPHSYKNRKGLLSAPIIPPQKINHHEI